MSGTTQTELANSADVAVSAELARQSGRLAIDTEFMSEGRYQALLCLTQVGVPDASEPTGIRTILIDGLDETVDVEPLAELLADPDIEIVLHAGRQDVAILRRAWRTDVCAIFDTQIAAGFAGEGAQSGYGNLLSAVLGLRVNKTASYTRWEVRPLTDEQLSYAAEDVAHLLQLADTLKDRLRTSGRYDWAVEECRRLESATDERDPESVWERLPKVSQLDPQARAVARQLAAWRERTAAREDRPVGSVVQDAPLVEIAKRHPTDPGALSQIRGLHPPLIKRHGRAIVDAVALGLGDPPIPREGRRAHSESGDTPLIALAEALLRARAIEAGLAYELLASRADLERVIAAARMGDTEPEVRMMSGWRRDLVGSDLEALLGGRMTLAVGSGHQLELHTL
jgi:ribonuclease D